MALTMIYIFDDGVWTVRRPADFSSGQIFRQRCDQIVVQQRSHNNFKLVVIEISLRVSL